jgi:hypothetical protein
MFSRLIAQTHLASRGHLIVDGLKHPVAEQGGGSLANHSTNFNTELILTQDPSGKAALALRATKGIKAGDEITLNYGLGLDIAMGEAHFMRSLDVDGRANVVKKVGNLTTWMPADLAHFVRSLDTDGRANALKKVGNLTTSPNLQQMEQS